MLKSNTPQTKPNRALKYKVLDKMTPELEQEITTLYTDSFINMNKIWKKLKIPYHEAEDLMRKRVQNAFHYGWINVSFSLILGYGCP